MENYSESKENHVKANFYDNQLFNYETVEISY